MPALITPEQAAQEILHGWERGAFEIHFPKRFTLWIKLLQLLPYRLYFAAGAPLYGPMTSPPPPAAPSPASSASSSTLTPADLARLGASTRRCAYFKDPFNEVQGVPAIQASSATCSRHWTPALRRHRPRGAGASSAF
jgi:hypothetical protein